MANSSGHFISYSTISTYTCIKNSCTHDLHWPRIRGRGINLGQFCWPLATSEGLPVVRGQINANVVDANDFWPHVRGGRW